MKRRISCFFTILLLGFTVCNALKCNSNLSDQKHVAYTITVDKSGKGHFTSVQSAIDSVPENNNRWIRIRISAGTYTEKITVPAEKPCLFFEGAGRISTKIEWGDSGGDITTSPTVSFLSDNVLVRGISFKNTHNFNVKPPLPYPWKQAVAARIDGDRVAFYDCGFVGIQDTLFDRTGRHYFRNCYIEGSIDFIFGDARSIYEKCHIYVNIGRLTGDAGSTGFITAQKREDSQDPGAFVFKYCAIKGVGKAFLGRAWGPYATVIFSRSYMSNVVSPEGWDSWNYEGLESNFMFVEANNGGAGSDTSRRVPWVKKFDSSKLKRFLSLSFINRDRWIQKLPI